MNTINKGDELEDKFYCYLLDQQNHGQLVFDIYPPECCKIFKQKKYNDPIRKGYVTFDVVIEIYRKGRSRPHLYVIFECKNHKRKIEERYVTDLSDKLNRLFDNSAKGVMVVSSALQKGAEHLALYRHIGIVKYDENGFDAIAERKGGLCVGNHFVKMQLYQNSSPIKSLKFSAYLDGKFFGTIDQLLNHIDPIQSDDCEHTDDMIVDSVSFFTQEEIRKSAQTTLNLIDYKDGSVDLVKICATLSIDLQFIDQDIQNCENEQILGRANFDRKSIHIYPHVNKQRERFTIAHEIGHICLNHGKYLRSETIVEKDLFIDSAEANSFNYAWLEFQANEFASELLLPEKVFKGMTHIYKEKLEIKSRESYIYVDDQYCNYTPYNELLSMLSTYFDVSKQAIEVKLKKLGRLNDKRKSPTNASFSQVVKNSNFYSKNRFS